MFSLLALSIQHSSLCPTYLHRKKLEYHLQTINLTCICFFPSNQDPYASASSQRFVEEGNPLLPGHLLSCLFTLQHPFFHSKIVRNDLLGTNSHCHSLKPCHLPWRKPNSFLSQLLLSSYSPASVLLSPENLHSSPPAPVSSIHPLIK